jgi:Ca-activated chloride channel family protein
MKLALGIVATAILAIVNVRALGAGAGPASSAAAAAQEAVFKAGVELVDVAATVTDGDGRFISGLAKDDFVISDDGKRQEIVSFSSERVPVSLAMLLDVSSSMTEEQLATARLAIDHFAHNLLDKPDELLLMEFAARGRILQPWTRDRELFSRSLTRVKAEPVDPVVEEQPDGTFAPAYSGTAIFDAVATSLGFAPKGANRKKAVLIISDGVDTTSRRTIKQVQEAIRASEVLVYALGVDADREAIRVAGGAHTFTGRVNADVLRKLTDETGGRTEVVKGFRNLDQATASLADEFNQQYVLGYTSPKRDGRWHTIKVEVKKKRGAKVRARAGYIAS